MAKSAASMIAWWFCTDSASISETKYQHGRTTIPVYVLGDDYYCCPPVGGAPARHRDGDNWKWQEIGRLDGRSIYRAKP